MNEIVFTLHNKHDFLNILDYARQMYNTLEMNIQVLEVNQLYKMLITGSNRYIWTKDALLALKNILNQCSNYYIDINFDISKKSLELYNQIINIYNENK